MCGIQLVTGVTPNKSKPAIGRMVDACTHRGPDTDAVYTSDSVSMGFNRLEIVGGPKSTQPISNEDGSITIIGNGEIFNHEDLRSRHGTHRYKTESDIEVLLHLYEELGTSFLDAVEGQFSIIIYDTTRKKVLLFRDRWGITPLFYSIQEERMVASSSVRAIIASKLINNIRLDPLGIAESWSLYGPTSPRTCFNNISQLPPASYGEYDLLSHSLKIESYTNKSRGLSKPLSQVLSGSVKSRLQGKYGPGVYVSGGVDSSIIAALAKQLSPVKPILFGIAFKNPEYDESSYQNMLAEHLGCELHNIHIDREDIINNLTKCVEFTESPLVRTAPVPMMLLSNEVRKQGLKYVLCGEGADELFAGYPVFVKGRSSILDKWSELSKYYSRFVDLSLGDRIQSEYQNFTDVGTHLDQLRQQEIETKLSRYLLVNQGDRVAMANSVEQRFPFLDTAVAEVAFSLGADDLIKGGSGKQLLRSSFKELLPAELLNRKKQGYLTPDFDVVKSLLDSGVLPTILSEEICKIVGIFRYTELKNLMDNLNTENDARFLLFAYTTHLLFQHFINSGEPENGISTTALTPSSHAGTLPRG